LAALYGKLTYVEVLLRRGADPLATDESLGTPLHDACASGHVDVARALCDAARRAGTLAASLSKVDEDEETPLHHAARGEHAEVVKYLIELGADKSAKSSVGATPLDLVEDDDSVRALFAA
jgi:ankyrin repeat protein